MSRQQERRRWRAMLYRCENPRSPSYRYYGARGIKVCERWHDFETYYADIMRLIGPCPDPRMSLDRIDNDGNYEPGNVRWASVWQQVRNSRTCGRPKNPHLYVNLKSFCPRCHRHFGNVYQHLAQAHPEMKLEGLVTTAPGRGTFVRKKEAR